MNSELNGAKCSKSGFLFGLFLVGLYGESSQASPHPLCHFQPLSEPLSEPGRSQLESLPLTACEMRGPVITACKYPGGGNARGWPLRGGTASTRGGLVQGNTKQCLDVKCANSELGDDIIFPGGKE